jgi:hypothetical protein
MSSSRSPVAKTVEDAAYVTIGLGLMAFQKAQVRRNELTKSLHEALGEARETIGDQLKVVEERLRAAIER